MFDIKDSTSVGVALNRPTGGLIVDWKGNGPI